MPEFKLDDAERKMFDEWKVGATKRAIQYQKDLTTQSEMDKFTYEVAWEMGFPYCGAIGGEYSFKVTPTSLGATVVAINNVTKEEKNITDFSNW